MLFVEWNGNQFGLSLGLRGKAEVLLKLGLNEVICNLEFLLLGSKGSTWGCCSCCRSSSSLGSSACLPEFGFVFLRASNKIRVVGCCSHPFTEGGAWEVGLLD